VVAYLSGRAPRIPQTAGVLAESHGAFVSIHAGDELRGCIGNTHPNTSLIRTVSECAVSAAVGDPRFSPLTLQELSGVDFEISVLSAMEKIDTIDKITIGEHGIFIAKRGVRGLLLPQVASRFGWTRERFLAETCRKAGLGAGEWKDGASIF